MQIRHWKETKTNSLCARGNFVLSSHFSIVNNCGPDEHHKSRNPFTGKQDAPVTNCNKSLRSLVLNESIALD